MAKINTVLGSIDSKDLGLTLPHEHIAAAYPGWECDPLVKSPVKDKIINICIRNLEPLKDYGVNAIIDATPCDLARDVDIMREGSERLQLHIVCATGRYNEEEGKWAYLKYREQAKICDIKNELYDGFMHEILQGIGKSGVKPGIIKVATGLNNISSCEKALLRAAALTTKETGVPIMTHTHDGTMGPEQADLLISEGVNPQKIVIGHMCGNPSLEYQIDVLSKGVYIAFDRFGIEMVITDKIRTEMLIGLLNQGYADRIMLSHDCTAATYSRAGQMPPEEAKKFMNWSFTNIFRNIIPALKKAGISNEQIKKMTVDNPRHFLTGLE